MKAALEGQSLPPGAETLPTRLADVEAVLAAQRQGRLGIGGPVDLRCARARRVRALLRECGDNPRDLRGLPRGRLDRSRAGNLVAWVRQRQSRFLFDPLVPFDRCGAHKLPSRGAGRS